MSRVKQALLDAYEQVEMDYANDTYVLQYLDEKFSANVPPSVEYYPPGKDEVKPKVKEWTIVASIPPGLDLKTNYYDVGGIEVIDYIKAKLTQEQFKGYLLGNIYKYSGRMQYKGEETKDAAKLTEYTTWLKELYDDKPNV